MSAASAEQAKAIALAEALAEQIMAGPFLGVIFAMMVYGATVLQAFYYFQNYPSDGKIIKSTVVTVMIIETSHTAFCIHFLYNYLILNYANPQSLATILWSMGTTVLVGVFAAFVVHCFFLWRIWILSNHNIWIVVGFFLIALARLGFGIASSIFSYKFTAWTSFHEHALSTVTAGLVLAVVIDTLIALTLTWLLRRRSSSVPAGTNHIVNSIIKYTIRTGTLTSVFSILCVVVFLVLPTNVVFLGISEIGSKLYANSLLATLNARKSRANNDAGVSQGSSGNYPAFSNVELGRLGVTSQPQMPIMQIKKDTIVERDNSVSPIGHQDVKYGRSFV